MLMVWIRRLDGIRICDVGRLSVNVADGDDDDGNEVVGGRKNLSSGGGEELPFIDRIWLSGVV
jgi:hypothetical protein